MNLDLKRVVGAVCAALISLVMAYAPADAQMGEPTMDVTAGFDGYCPRQGWCPVRVVLANAGPAVEGTLQVGVVEDVQDTRWYAAAVRLPTQSRKAYTLYVPLPNTAVRASFIVRLRASGGDVNLVADSVEVEWQDPEDRLYGVISSDPSALNFLSDLNPASGRAAVAHFPLDALPADAIGWDVLDVLVISDVDTAALSPDQRRALETWVHHGGHLVVGGGTGAAATLAGLGSLLPVQLGQVRAVDDLSALGGRLDEGPFPVVDASWPAGEVALRQGDLDLIVRRASGAGTVTFLAFDAALNPFARWDDALQLWREILRDVDARDVRPRLRNSHSAEDAVNAVPGVQVPSTFQILLFMVAYTLLIGPANYLLLRKLGRQELAWLTIPLLVLSFTLFSYVTGFQIRGREAIVHQVSLVYVPEGAPTGAVSQLVGLFSPRRTTYDVHVSAPGLRALQRDFTEANMDVLLSDEGLILPDLRVDVGGIQPFLVEGHVPVSPVEADLRLVPDAADPEQLRLQGTLYNGDRPLHDAVLVLGDQSHALGDLAAGQVMTVDLSLASPGLTLSGTSGGYTNYRLPELVLGSEDYWSDRALYRRYQLLMAFFPYDSPGLGPGVHLLGWSTEPAPLEVAVAQRSFAVEATTLYVHPISIRSLESGETLVVPSSLVTREVEERRGAVDIWGDEFHLGAEAEVVFRFDVSPGATLRQVDTLLLTIEGGSAGSTLYAPQVSLWRVAEERWETLDVAWGRHEIPDGDAYHLPGGGVRVRLKAEQDMNVHHFALTMKGRR